MDPVLPEYDRVFSLATNNLPFPKIYRDRWLRYRGFPTRPGYQRVPDSEPEIELEEVRSDPVEPEIQETEFHNPVEDTRIDIEPFDGIAESTPLLGGAAASAPVFGGAASVVGTGGSLATGILAGSAGVVAGVVGKQLLDRTSEKGAVLPGSEYIGPGNPIPISAAKDAGDQAAKEHDVNYGNLIEYARNNPISQKEFTERVHQFDQSAIDEFERDWQTTGNWRSFVGKYGLKVKQAAEQLYGQSIYPSCKYAMAT